MRGSLPPQNTPKVEQTVGNKSSIEGAEVEGAMHPGLRNVKNAIICGLGLGRGRHFSLPLSRDLSGFALEPHPLSYFPFLCNFIHSSHCQSLY